MQKIRKATPKYYSILYYKGKRVPKHVIGQVVSLPVCAIRAEIYQNGTPPTLIKQLP